jgi:hypothetical protein
MFDSEMSASALTKPDSEALLAETEDAAEDSAEISELLSKLMGAPTISMFTT